MTNPIVKAFADADNVDGPEFLALVPEELVPVLEESVGVLASAVIRFGAQETDITEADLMGFLAGQLIEAFIAGMYYDSVKVAAYPTQDEEVFIQLDSQERMAIAKALLGENGLKINLGG